MTGLLRSRTASPIMASLTLTIALASLTSAQTASPAKFQTQAKPKAPATATPPTRIDLNTATAEQMTDESGGVTAEEELGQAREHAAAHVVLRQHGAVHEAAPAHRVADEASLLQPRQQGRDGGGRERPVLLAQGLVDLRRRGLAAIPQHPQQRQLQVAELGGLGRVAGRLHGSIWQVLRL